MPGICIVLAGEGPLKELAIKDAEVSRAVDLWHESFTACPSYASGPKSWTLFRSRYPEVAAAVAKSYLKNDVDLLEDEITARLEPYDSTMALKAYWRARMEKKENVALKIVKDAKSMGIPLPIEVP